MLPAIIQATLQLKSDCIDQRNLAKLSTTGKLQKYSEMEEYKLMLDQEGREAIDNIHKDLDDSECILSNNARIFYLQSEFLY